MLRAGAEALRVRAGPSAAQPAVVASLPCQSSPRWRRVPGVTPADLTRRRPSSVGGAGLMPGLLEPTAGRGGT
jgi:hypothetical protein